MIRPPLRRCSRQPVGYVGDGDIGRLALAHRQAVQVTAVLWRQPGDEARLPDWREAVRLTGRCQAGEQRRCEQRAAMAANGNVVNVEIARGVADLRNIECVVALVHLAVGDGVLEPPELEERGHPQRLAIAGQSHAAVEVALMDRLSAVRLQADQEQLAALLGGEGQAQPLVRQPFRELARAVYGQFRLRFLRRLHHATVVMSVSTSKTAWPAV